jgi:hypothetical protein
MESPELTAMQCPGRVRIGIKIIFSRCHGGSHCSSMYKEHSALGETPGTVEFLARIFRK